MKTEFDEETEKWFSSRPYTETTVMQCEKCHLWSESTLMQCAECGLWYKPSLGHKCKKMAEAQEKGKGKKWKVTWSVTSTTRKKSLRTAPFRYGETASRARSPLDGGEGRKRICRNEANEESRSDD